ncbi:MAG: hypothetical protein AAB483_02495 [Patescibacteria group bacterium]
MNNKTLLGIVIAAAVVIIIVVMTRSSTTPDTTPTPTASASASVSVSTSPAAVGTPAKTLSYEDALKKYPGTRFQFDTTCQARPSSMVIKKGTPVMLDNRANVARTITIGTTKYTLAKYGFRIVTPTSAKYPVTFFIDCDKQQNVATLLIQQ